MLLERVRIFLPHAELPPLRDDETRLFDRALCELEKLRAQMTSSYRAAMAILEHAATLADGSAVRFVELTEMCFAHRSGLRAADEELTHQIAIAAVHPASGILGRIFARLASDDFNANVLARGRPALVMHHFAEFLLIGVRAPRVVAERAVTHLDHPHDSAPAVRNAFFAVMLGDACADGVITPYAAMKLIAWAFAREEKQVAWGTRDLGAEHFTRPSDYALADWVRAYNRAYAPKPIRLRAADRKSPQREAWIAVALSIRARRAKNAPARAVSDAGFLVQAAV